MQQNIAGLEHTGGVMQGIVLGSTIYFTFMKGNHANITGNNVKHWDTECQMRSTDVTANS